MGSTVAPKLLYGCIPVQEHIATRKLASAQTGGHNAFSNGLVQG